ncbi:tolB protein precursor, periplasmic protein involved in the tonb-independent uptake of group A colicins [hydrothermal vent metagenome]|uniref:TolB protein, periplasmic protein involved in the tonb-independent uptake of group A colicins n=1 Tax=hydrothermal vent metagenome TaxID=652676 RepID=A0A3B0TV38_9ZZZZ
MRKILFLLTIIALANCKTDPKKPIEKEEEAISLMAGSDTLIYPEEKYFKSIRQITFGGDNAEAYWSFDDKQLIFQSNYKGWGMNCDQMFLMNVGETFKNKKPPMVSTGMGRTTCAYFLPDNQYIVYGSTHLADKECPEVPLRKNGKYVWPVYDTFDIFVADLDGNITAQLTNEPGYDAEATVSPKGDKIVFTSTRSGDLELYTMNLDGTNVKQITDELGYDGGAFFSPDGAKIIFRASRPKTEAAIKEYKDLLAKGLVQPTEMELFICNADGSDLKQLTFLGNANWSPFFHPSGKKILFSSNFEAEKGFPFNLYFIDIDGKNLERVTHGETFDAFPVFSNDGKYLAFSSNRNNGGTRDTNLFIAEWQE